MSTYIFPRTPSTTPEMIESYRVQNNENYEACKKCGGVCCQKMGCEIYPQDVKRWFKSNTITVDMIVALLNTGKVQLDWWEGDVRYDEFNYESTTDCYPSEYMYSSYYLHMRNGKEPRVHGSWGGTCVLFNKDTGCPLSWALRPTGGKSLKPEPNGNWAKCSASDLSKADCCLAWSAYDDILLEVYSEYETPEEDTPLEIFLSLGR